MRRYGRYIAKARGLSLRTGAHTMLYPSLSAILKGRNMYLYMKDSATP